MKGLNKSKRGAYMKVEFSIQWIVILLIMVIAVSCSEDNDVISEEEDKGYLQLNVELDVQAVSGRSLDIDTDDWSVVVYDENDRDIYTFDNFSEVPDQLPLEVGQYTVYIASDDENVAFDAPMYAGTSEVFAIDVDEVVPVTVSTTLANVKVSVSASDLVPTKYSDWTTTVSTADGFIKFNKDEIRSAYFPAGSQLIISTELIPHDSNLGAENVVLSAEIPNTSAQDHYLVNVDYALNGGLAEIRVLVDETTNDVAVDLTAGEDDDNGEAPTGYCDSKGNNSSYEWLSYVQVGSLINSSGNNGGYQDFTELSSATFRPGNEVSYELRPGFSSSVYREAYRIWIDLNRDGDFEDSDELLLDILPTSAASVTGSFLVPESVSLGATRMRVTMKYNSTPLTCESFSYGEVEDYEVILSN